MKRLRLSILVILWAPLALGDIWLPSKALYCISLMDVASRPNINRISSSDARAYLRDFRVNVLLKDKAAGTSREIVFTGDDKTSDKKVEAVASRVRGLELDLSHEEKKENVADEGLTFKTIILKFQGRKAIDGFLDNLWKEADSNSLNPALNLSSYLLSSITQIVSSAALMYLIRQTLLGSNSSKFGIINSGLVALLGIDSFYWSLKVPDWSFSKRKKYFLEKLKTISLSNQWFYMGINAQIGERTLLQKDSSYAFSRPVQIWNENSNRSSSWPIQVLERLEKKVLLVQSDMLLSFDDEKSEPILLVFTRFHEKPPVYPATESKRLDNQELLPRLSTGLVPVMVPVRK